MSKTALKIDDLYAGYRKKEVIKNLSVQFQQGSINLIMGKNGCGKTTLLTVISGIIKPGKGIVSSAFPASRIGYVPQKDPMIPELSVMDNLMVWYGGKKKVLEAMDTPILQKLGISTMLKMKVSELSGGMAKRCSIACAMAGDPKIMLMDEPGAALDVESKTQLRYFMKKYASDGGTLLFTSHDLIDVEWADHVFLMQEGSLQEISDPTPEKMEQLICGTQKYIASEVRTEHGRE